jgi:outer membrane receptor protein involved in Fe transport
MSTPSLVGTYDRRLDSTRVIAKEGLNFLDYRYLGGILETFPGVFIRDHFNTGDYNQLNIRGVDWRSIAITANGRLMNDPSSGVYNLYQFTPEYADRIEFVSGPRSFLYGLNSAGGAVNLVTKNYNSNRPLTKLNYAETSYRYQYSDGTFSQNISRKVNFTFGFQHQGTEGRFANSAHEAWNMRVKLRYNLSKDFNIIVSEYLTNSETQLNGGIDVRTTGIPALAFDPIQAIVVNEDAFEKISRHDMDISLVGTLLGDSTNVSMLTLYYSTNFREYRDKRNNFNVNDVRIDSDHRSSWMGALFTQDFHTEWQRFNLGANIELRQIEGSPNLGRRRNSLGSIWAKEEFLFESAIAVAGFAR